MDAKSQSPPISLRVIFEANSNGTVTQTKFKYLLDDPTQTFGQLKQNLLARVATLLTIDQLTEAALYSLCDDQDFEFSENDTVLHQLQHNDTLKIVSRQPKQQVQPEPQQPAIEKEPHIIDPQLQQQHEIQVDNTKSDPTEAIVVLVDVSGSMQANFFNDLELSRMGAVNALFSAFADKTLAFEYNHLVQLYTFQSAITKKCEFMEDMNLFINLIDGCSPGGGTRLFDALDTAVKNLVEIKKTYPNIILRIIALTDGEDNESKISAETVARDIVKHRIVLDSFVVSDQSQGLKNVTHASGGRCYCPRDLFAGMKLFEVETILSVKARDLPIDSRDPSTIYLKDFESRPFDTEGLVAASSVQKNHEGGNINDVINKFKNQVVNPSNTNSGSASNAADAQNKARAVKRLVRELELVSNQSNTFKAKVFPEANDIQKWKVLLIGPEGTAYAAGVFVVYLTFPDEYPMKPPRFRFITPLYHPNVTSSGQVCLDELTVHWKPDFTCINMINSISQLLIEPNQANAVESGIAAEINHEKELYKTKCEEHVKTHARLSVEELLREVLGVNVDVTTEDYKKANKDISDWLAINRP